MLDSGNMKLSDCVKHLGMIRVDKDQIQAELIKAQQDVHEKQLKQSSLNQRPHSSHDDQEYGPPCKKQKH